MVKFMQLGDIVHSQYDLTNAQFVDECRKRLDRDGVLVLPDFIGPSALATIKIEAAEGMSEAYFCANSHNVYLTPPDEAFAMDHPRNREVVSSKGLIGDDQVPDGSPLKALYRDPAFQKFIADTVREEELYPYADPLSAVNIHYAKTGQELGWHFDNSSFAITLLIDKPDGGGEFEYLRNVRDADAGEYNFETVGKLLNGEIGSNRLNMDAGTLVLFRGRNSIHRVTPTQGDKTRMLAVLAYNSEPGIELSESARMTFYGRLG